jgi:hypothetical protein
MRRDYRQKPEFGPVFLEREASFAAIKLQKPA